jgi:hypothetical protein
MIETSSHVEARRYRICSDSIRVKISGLSEKLLWRSFTII